MPVDIQNTHPFASIYQVLNGYGDVVKQAKTRCPGRVGVVTEGAHYGKSLAFGGQNGGADGITGCLITQGAHHGIFIEVAAPKPDFFYSFNIIASVHEAQQRFAVGQGRIGKIGESVQPFWIFRMMMTGFVLQKNPVVEDVLACVFIPFPSAPEAAHGYAGPSCGFGCGGIIPLPSHSAATA